MRKPVSILLSVALAALAPGLAPYEVLAGVGVRAGGSVRSGGLTVKTPPAALVGGSAASLQTIVPGAVVSNLDVIDPAVVELAPPVQNAAQRVVLPAAAPTLAPSGRTTGIVPAPPGKASPARSQGPQARGPPSGFKSLRGFEGRSFAAQSEGAPRAGSGRSEAPSGSFSLASALSAQSVRFDGAALRAPMGGNFSFTAPSGPRPLRRLNLRRNNPADAGAGFNALDEIGVDAEEAGVFEPRLDGTLDVSHYKVPLALRARRAGLLSLHYAGIASFAVFLAFGFGWIPAAVGFGAAGTAALALRAADAANDASSAFVPEGTGERDLFDLRDDLIRLQSGDPLNEEASAAIHERVAPLYAFMDWAEGAAQVLVNRAGFDGYRAPRLWFGDSDDPYAAYSSLGDIDRASSLHIGVGFLIRPLGETLAMMGHELGHLFHRDHGFLRNNFRLNSQGSGFLRGVTAAGAVTTVSAVAAGVLYAAHAVAQGAWTAVDPVSAAVSVGWIAAAFTAALTALLAGFAATRQEELRADYFSAWLTHPQWWISWLRMRRAALDDALEWSENERSPLRRLWDRLMSMHPDYDVRIAALEAFKDERIARDIPMLPASDSVYGLNGETTLVLDDFDAEALEALQTRLEGPFEARAFFVEREGEATGSAIVRVHRTDRVQLDAKTDAEVVAAMERAVSKAAPQAKIVSAVSKPHEVFRWAAKSRAARAVLRSLKKSRVPIRWDTTLGPEDARGIFRPDGENGPEILVNPAVLFKASPKALLALIAHEGYHAGVWSKMREIGIDWLNLGGLEFERLAHTIGLRVFKELGGTELDDVDDAAGGPVFTGAVREWKSMEEDEHIEFLRTRGYDAFVRLRDLRALAPRDLAAELGAHEDPETIARKVEALWKFYESERRAERRWRFWSLLR